MGRTLMGDVGNGKGSRKRIGADDKKYADNWDKIFGKPCGECGIKGGQHKMSCSMNWRGEEPDEVYDQTLGSVHEKGFDDPNK